MTRAVIVSTRNDDLLKYWKKVNDHWLKDVVLHVVKSNNDLPYPKGVEEMIKQAGEDVLLIMHDDVFVYNAGLINSYFTIAEQGKVVSPLHKNYNKMDEVEMVMKQNYGKIMAFYPYFLFIRKDLIMKTSIDLNGRKDFDFNGLICSGDQGFVMCCELLEMGVDFEALPISDPPNWIHAQDLTYGFFEYPISYNADKLAWASILQDIDPLEIACLARKYKNYE